MGGGIGRDVEGRRTFVSVGFNHDLSEDLDLLSEAFGCAALRTILSLRGVSVNECHCLHKPVPPIRMFLPIYTQPPFPRPMMSA